VSARDRTGSYLYALIRVVPRVERGEFVNAGVVLFAREHRFLGVTYALDPARVRTLWPAANFPLIERHLATFQAVAEGHAEGGPVASLPQPDRFHWLTAPRSTIIQTSPVHAGLSADPAATLDELFERFVRVPA
jgi:hypothetical protein